MKTPLILITLFASTTAFAQTAETSPVAQAPTTYQSQTEARLNGGSTQLQAASGPVTLTWGQSRGLPNAADYQATVADLDTNGDGTLTRAEVPERHALHSEFKLVDANHDGRITQAELSNWR